VFIDPSMTTEFYTEFEMTVLNCTYDIKWGVPDGAPLKCGGDDPSVLPTCKNTRCARTPVRLDEKRRAFGKGGKRGCMVRMRVLAARVRHSVHSPLR
jgi:hypothetical protein